MGIDPFQAILFLLGFGSILFLAYVTTRYLAGKTNRALKGKYIQIIETVNLGLDKRIHLVKAGSQYVLLAATSKRIEFLTTVDIGEEAEKITEDSSPKNVFDFKAMFDKYINAYKSKKNSASLQENEDKSTYTSKESDFRANLGRLKTITHKGRQVGDNEDESTNEK